MENQKNELQDQKEQILSDVGTFAKAEYEAARLLVIDKASRWIGALLLAICLILVVFAVLAFCAVAAVLALALYVPAWAACLIVGGVYLLLIPILAACSKVMFINPIIRQLSGIKNTEALQMEMVRAQGRAAVQRERMFGYVRLVKALYAHYTRMTQTVWGAIRGLFHKK